MTTNDKVNNPNPAEKVATKITSDSLVIPVVGSTVKQIRRITVPTNDPTVLQNAADFKLRAEAAAPVAGSLLDIVNGANCKFAKIVAKKRTGCDEKKASELAEYVSISSESLAASAKAGARMLARRIKNDELLDILVLCGTGGELIAGWTALASELKEIDRLRNGEAK